MSTINLTAGNFTRTLGKNPIVFVEFWAPWCSTSRAFTATYEAAANRHTDIVFARVDIEAEPSLADASTITSVPTLAAFRNNVLVFSLPGVLNATGLEEAIQEVREAGSEQVLAGTSVLHS
jgi:thioredoxin 1